MNLWMQVGKGLYRIQQHVLRETYRCRNSNAAA
ncbi:Uncharacterised protein [Vibrio cholerae]|uniref:Uncharacterized protein n=1 Tax=Vibrio cholerae TaxID=666 RepID=A0A655WTM7_VIBCL|nr:Uncharacterised protein [Vibrio cholerae]CSB97588.1 Uncharacterised protein [Vibrio cholerae]CSI62535.1 Uncharacterised protein [Vibrio cholerae]